MDYFIKTLQSMGKNTKLKDLKGLNEIKKAEMHDIVGGEVRETKPKKDRWFSFCGGKIRQ